MPNKTIADLWQSYNELVIPKNAGEIQIKETQQAFYAGACSLFTAIMNSLSSDEENITESDLTFMASIQQEIDAWGQQVDRDAFGSTEH